MTGGRFGDASPLIGSRARVEHLPTHNRMLLNLPWGSSQPVDGYSEVATQTGSSRRLWGSGWPRAQNC